MGFLRDAADVFKIANMNRVGIKIQIGNDMLLNIFSVMRWDIVNYKCLIFILLLNSTFNGTFVYFRAAYWVLKL